MTISCSIKDIHDPEIVEADGTVVQDKIRELSNTAAKDIRECANACDAWNKKSSLMKVLCGPVWVDKLAEYSARFARKQIEFECALRIHTAVTVDDIAKVVRAVKNE